MIVATLLCVLAQTQTGPIAPLIHDPASRRDFERAQAALSANPELLGLHRGLRAYLENDDELREAEEGWQSLQALPTVRTRAADFEEALRTDAEARGFFESYNARLRRDKALRDAVANLESLEADARRSHPEIHDAFAYLRANPDAALKFLERPTRLVPAPPPLVPLRERLRFDVKLEGRLHEAWLRLDAMAGAREAVYPWWHAAYQGEGVLSKRFRALDDELSPFEARRRAWEARQIAWAAHPEALAWRDHTYARIRRDPALGSAFYNYTRTLREQPEVARRANAEFTKLQGAAPTWPPKGTPPELPVWRANKDLREPTRPTAPTVHAPREPEIQRPDVPQPRRPATPIPPTAPQPDKAPTQQGSQPS